MNSFISIAYSLILILFWSQPLLAGSLRECSEYYRGAKLYSGAFESHITISDTDAESVERFSSAIHEFKNSGLIIKPVLIALPEGQNPVQPMTRQIHRGSIEQVYQQVREVAGALGNQGFSINRMKIEAMAISSGVPQTSDEAKQHSRNNYFEFHLKLKLPLNTDPHLLETLVEKHDAHLSRNNFSQREDYVERFVTQRIYTLGKIEAEERFEALLQDFRASGYVFGKTLREYAVFDSNVELDGGWIDEE